MGRNEIYVLPFSMSRLFRRHLRVCCIAGSYSQREVEKDSGYLITQKGKKKGYCATSSRKGLPKMKRLSATS